MKKNIDLVINGIAPEKVMYDTDNHSLVVLYPEQKEFKVGDKVRLKKNLDFKVGETYNGFIYVKGMDDVKDAILTIESIYEFDSSLKAYNNIDGDWWWYRPEWLEHVTENAVEFKRGDIVFEDGRIMIVKDMPFHCYVLYSRKSNSFYTNGIYGVPFSASTHRLATPDEQRELFDILKKEGKKWNAETLEIEDLDISEIVYDLETACKYLNIERPSHFILDEACERSNKFEAQMELQLIREAWNKFDGFDIDLSDYDQPKYHPVLDVNELVKYYTLRSSTDISASCYSFRTSERALQFGNQFKDLFKTALGLN